MRLSKSVSKNATSLYVIESTYIHGKRSTRTVESLGTLEELSKVHDDPIAWAQDYVRSLNEKQKKERAELQDKSEVLIRLNASKPIAKDTQVLFNGGYLFLEKLFYEFGLNKICESIQANSKADYSLTDILSRLVYGRILFPGSKQKTYSMLDHFLEPASFELHDLYRALTVLGEHSEEIQSQLYKNTHQIQKRNSSVLYYDCTNYFFEIQQEDDLRKYGHCKEHRPNPIVQMGLMMDSDGIPLAFDIHPGNTSEQVTLTPLEERIERDYEHAKFVVCTDAGLCSMTNKLFNSRKDKGFVTTQSLKKMARDIQEKSLQRTGWKILNDRDGKDYSLDEIESTERLARENGVHSIFYDKLFWHEVRDVPLEVPVEGSNVKELVRQTIYVTFSLKYRDYLRMIRNGQIERAAVLAHEVNKPIQRASVRKKNPNDYARFINSVSATESGEIASHTTYYLNEELIGQEEAFDGFYAVSTNLDEPVGTILDISKKRWEIEECFRITKTTFKARPVYVTMEEHIRAHFLTCFIALILYRYLERRVSTPEQSYTTDDIIEQLRNMNFVAYSGSGYVPVYKRTTFTDRLHQVFGFRTDYEIIQRKMLKKLIQKIKAV